MTPARLGFACIAAFLALTTGGLGAPPPGISIAVNDPAFDEGKGDGTNDTQLNPVSTFWGPDRSIGLTMFDRPSGGTQGIGSAYTTNGGETWRDNGNVNGGSNSLHGRTSIVWNEKTKRYAFASENTFGPSGQMPIAVAESSDGGATWGQIIDTDTSIGGGIVARHPSLEVNNTASSAFFGHYYLGYTRGSSGSTTRDFMYQKAPGITGWTTPIRINPAGCTNVGYAELALAADLIFGAYTCEDGDTYMPMVSSSTDQGATWDVVADGLPAGLTHSGDADPDCGSFVNRTIGGGIAAFDRLDFDYNPAWDMLHLTMSYRGTGSDQSNVYIYGAREEAGPLAWSRYGTLPGDNGATYAFPALGTNESTTNPTYMATVAVPGGPDLVFKNYSSSNGRKWDAVRIEASYKLPVLDPNEDTRVPDCLLGKRLFDHNGMGDAIGLTYVGTFEPPPPPPPPPRAQATDVNPDIFFVRLQAPKRTRMTMAIAHTDTKINATGRITPVVEGFANVTLSRKTDGGFRKVTTKSARFDDEGRFKTSFSQPSGESCRIQAKFVGSNTHAPSKVTKTFSCKG